MTKKKTFRPKHQKSVSAVDTSEEESNFKGKVCLHITRGLNFARVKRNLKATNLTICSNCTDIKENEESPEVWLCLQCGNRGCGRMSEHKHALQHYKTIHSDCHALVLSSSSGVVWCYDCDDEVHLQQSRNLRQCVEFLMKTSGNKNVVDAKKSSSLNQQSLLESVLRDQIAVKSAESNPKSVNKKDCVLSKLFTRGLRNLGNTCFFNAVMQNLNQTYLLFKVLDKTCSADYTWEVPRLTIVDGSVVEDINDEILKIAISRQFPLATSLLTFYKQMSIASSNKNEVVNPSSLFSEIAKKSPQFKHFQEQDSHELLRQLLDGMRQDEVKRQKKAILRHFDVSNISPEEIDDDTKKLIKAYSSYASHTLIEKIFGGLFISTVLCEECKMSSQVFEPFMDMSLPLFEEKQQDNCNQPYLEGGQQQDFKPLRIRKADADKDDEYVVNKYKQDSGKPSKYQERKMKQLARKEKKKKNKGKKISESNEDPQVEEAVLEENGLDNNENEEFDTVSKDEKFKDEHQCNGLDSVQAVDAEHQDNVLLPETANLTDSSLPIEEKPSDVNEVDEVINIDTSIIKNGNLHDDQNLILGNDLGEISCALDSDDKTLEKTIPGQLEHLILFDEEVLIDLKTEKVPIENCIDVTQSSSEKKEMEQKTETKTTVPDPADMEQSLEALVEDFKDLNISSTNTLEPDERMQALRLQVKSVRIRCDSDIQDSLFDSSQSNNDGTNFTSSDSREYTYGNESEDNWSHTLSENQTKEWILKSLLPLKPRVQIPPNECSIDSCLSYFTKPELLTGRNKFRCEKCTEIKIQETGNKNDVVYSNASKQLLIFSPPAILTLHLKRFQQVGMTLRKVNRFVEFPTTLDLAPYCSSACQLLPHVTSVKDEILYSLYGIVEHSGRMSSGHYTAYVKISKRTLNENFMCHLPLAQCDLELLLQKFSKIGSEKKNSDKINDSEDYQWYYVSDNHVREVNETQVLRCQAYLLFYERIK